MYVKLSPQVKAFREVWYVLSVIPLVRQVKKTCALKSELFYILEKDLFTCWSSFHGHPLTSSRPSLHCCGRRPHVCSSAKCSSYFSQVFPSMSNKESRLSRTNAKMVLNHIDELCRVPLLFSRNIFPLVHSGCGDGGTLNLYYTRRVGSISNNTTKKGGKVPIFPHDIITIEKNNHYFT